MKVVVVGGSVAGASLARLLALGGADVTLHEKARFPRPKACGEGLLPPGVAALRDMGLEPPAFPGVRGMRFVAPSGASVEGDFPAGRGLVVRRDRFDAWLLGEARAAGVDVREGSPAPEEIEADVIVAADGLHSRWIPGEPDTPARVGMAAHVRGLPADDRVEVRFHADGEAYIAPCGDVTLVAALMRVSRFRCIPDGDAIRHLLAPREIEYDAPALSVSPLGRRVAEVVRGNLLAIGDAAGAPDPITGEGMSLALRSAPVAAEAILAGRLESYARWRIEAGDEARAFGRRLMALSRWADAVIPRLRKRPDLLAALLEVATGRRRLREVKLRHWAGLIVG